MIYYGTKTPPPPTVIFEPPVSPYKHYVAAEGITESVYKNIFIGSSFQDLITKIYVKVGDIVKQGDPLFKTDTRQFEAQLIQNLQNLKLAEVEYENQKVQFSFYENLSDKSAVSEQAYATALYNLKMAEESVKIAKAAVNVTETSIARSTVLAPINGEVLQLNIRVGEYANVNPTSQTPLIIFGDTNYYHLRIEVDEEDAWRIIPGSPGMAYVRGNSKIAIPLKYVYFEPYVVPKKSFTGDDEERIDTRVFQVVYAFPKDKYPVYYGQLLDIYLEARPSEGLS
jgi:RND family efflux transporter MFP subunit